jgi:hypothetical protein
MIGINRHNKCKHIRGWLSEAISRHINPDAQWLQHHIKNCPRCQQRLVSYGKVHLAMSALKSQPQKLDLLMRANSQTIGVLKHSLRRAQKAGKLEKMRPEPKFLEKCSKYSNSAINVAACMAIVILMKFGVFSSMNMCQRQGQKVIKKYYTNNIGDDLADDIFPNNNITPLG